jgi:hypothetical protein
MMINDGGELPETAAVITALIVERPLCLDCLASKTALTPTVIDHALAMIGTAMSVRRNTTLCRACGETKETVSLRRPDAT